MTLPPLTLTPPKEQKVKYLNFAIAKAIVNIFAENFHAGRAAIDMKHIKREGQGPSLLDGLGVWLWPKLNFSEYDHYAY